MLVLRFKFFLFKFPTTGHFLKLFPNCCLLSSAFSFKVWFNESLKRFMSKFILNLERHLMKKYFVSLVLFLAMSASHAFSRDVIDKNSKRFVLVARFEIESTAKRSDLPENERVMVLFRDCIQGIPESCRQIGPKSYYSLSELTSQRNKEYSDAFARTFLLDPYVIWSFFTGTWTTAAMLGVTFNVEPLVVGSGVTLNLPEIAGVLGGLIMAGAVVTTIDMFNPKVQFEQAQTLSNEILDDHEKEVNDIDRFIKHLTEVLNQCSK